MTDSEQERIREAIRWVYSEVTTDHILRPRNLGAIAGASGLGRLASHCGNDVVAISLKVKDNTITAIGLEVEGCAATVACGSMVTELARGQSLAGALAISEEALIEALGGLPEGNRHCAALAVSALREAIRDYFAYRNEPWKRAYLKT